MILMIFSILLDFIDDHSFFWKLNFVSKWGKRLEFLLILLIYDQRMLSLRYWFIYTCLYVIEKNVYSLPTGFRNLHTSIRPRLLTIVKICNHTKFLSIWLINYWEHCIKIFHYDYVFVKFLQEFYYFLLHMYWKYVAKSIQVQNYPVFQVNCSFFHSDTYF